MMVSIKEVKSNSHAVEIKMDNGKSADVTGSPYIS